MRCFALPSVATGKKKNPYYMCAMACMTKFLAKRVRFPVLCQMKIVPINNARTYEMKREKNYVVSCI